MVYDCIIIGGGPAGLNAALVLGRAKLNVLLVDNENPRNKVTGHSHGFITNDHLSPKEIREKGFKDLLRYPNISKVTDRVMEIIPDENFLVITEKNQYEANRILIASGMNEKIPDVDGLMKLYGKRFFNCPFCDGWEMKDKKLRIEDALSATKAAVEEGIVAGGGTALINVVPAVEKTVNELTGGEKLGAEIVLKSLEEPVKQIARNAGLEPAVIADNVRKAEVGVGFDASKEEYVDMKKAGIVDPTKVTRSALQNAASIASMVITTESLVTDIPEKDCHCGHEGGMGAAGMDGMY